jgi:hypothetical protein
MDTARRLLETAQFCIAAERFVLKKHFTDRMNERGLFWPDVLAIVDAPTRARSDGMDEFGRPRLIVEGTAADGLRVGFACVLDSDDRGDVTVFITMY